MRVVQSILPRRKANASFPFADKPERERSRMNLKQIVTLGQSQAPVENAAEPSNSERFLTLVVEGAALGVPEIDSAAYSAFRSSVAKLALQLPDRLNDDEKLAQIRSVVR